jgi:nucleotide-binding universal stress UspA family protein
VHIGEPEPDPDRRARPTDIFELGTDGPKVLVVGIDGSDSAMRAGSYASGMARRQGSRIIGVYVRPVGSRWPSVAGAVAGLEQSSAEVAEELMAEAKSRTAELGIRNWEFRVERGDPYRELCRIADAVRADGVFVGASMQAQHKVAGSLALRLVKTGRWPVTVVP